MIILNIDINKFIFKAKLMRNNVSSCVISNNITSPIAKKKIANISIQNYQIFLFKNPNLIYLNFFNKKKLNKEIRLKGYQYIYPYWTYFINKSIFISTKGNLLNNTILISFAIENYTVKKTIFLKSPLINFFKIKKIKKLAKYLKKF